MKYSVKKNENLLAGIKRIISQIALEAVAEIEQPMVGMDELIHNTRKKVKFIRAAVILINNEIENTVLRRYDKLLKNINKQSSKVRDLYVLKESVSENMISLFENSRADIEIVRDSLAVSYQAQVIERPLDKILYEYRIAFSSFSSVLEKIEFSERKFKRIKSPIQKNYVCGKHHLGTIKRNYHSQILIHEWRRTAKDLHYQLHILRTLWPPVIGSISGEFKLLSDQLGDINDLFLLEKYISENVMERTRSKNIKILIEKKRIEILDTSIVLGSKLYIDSPEKFIQKLRKYYQLFSEN